ncbi:MULTISPECIES: hypothetical protein [unclassified Streptomyces]|uniref:hypothetical protein n=1 Tax=unclassified Streptomyces TaxID=2593676 RepID=UPI0027E3B665|nr:MULTISPECIES: hypothetical protein [unclassified Streptomyces]
MTIESMIVSLAALLPSAGTHASTTYADWAAAHDPGAAGAARDLVADMGSELARSWTKPGRFVDTMAARARRLPPAHLPWFWDTVGHRLIGYGNRPAARAYGAARTAEAKHGLPVDPGYGRANALLFAAGGAMPAKEFGAHQRFLADTLQPAAAHAALDAFLMAWAGSSGDLPADLVRRVRASAKAAGYGDEEVARLVAAVLSGTRKKSVPDALLTAAGPFLAAHPPEDPVAAALVEVFPEGATDGGAWLRLLIGCGATAAMEAGRVVPEGGLHHWVGHFTHMYQYATQSGGGVGRQPLPSELLALVGRLGPRLRASGAPVTLHTTRHHYQGFDADVLDTVLAAGVAVVAVGPDGERGSCRFTVPEDATLSAVHYVGGSFLVSWTLAAGPHNGDTAVWAHRPDAPFTPDETGGLVPFGGSLDGAYGFQFETADGGGRHSGSRVLRPGGTEGIDRDELQLGDGARIWTNTVYGRRPWQVVDAVTGEPRGARPLPDFPGRAPDAAPAAAPHTAAASALAPGVSEEGMALAVEALQLAPLPTPLTGSPLGSRDGLVGTRVLFRTGHRDPAPGEFLVESVDGRTARFTVDRPGQEPWGLWSPPEGAVEDVVLAEAQTRTGVRAYAADGALLWELDGHRSPRHPWLPKDRKVTLSTGVALPPAFWYLLRTRDAAGSRALRTVEPQAADALLAAALDDTGALRAAVARELPQVTDAVLVEAVVAVAGRAARVEERRRALHRRVTLLAEAPPALPRRTAPDTELIPALSGLVTDGVSDPWRRAPDEALPATLSALAADGACLAGTIGEDVRRLSPPAPPHDWSQLVGTVDAVAWRAAVAPTPAPARAALLAFLDTWADGPLARAGGRWWVGVASGSGTLDELRAGGRPVASAPVRGGGSAHWFVTAAAQDPDGDPAETVTVHDPTSVPAEAATAHGPRGAPAERSAERARLVRVERDDAARLRALVAAVDERGPVPVPESAAARFAELTGVRRPVARLVVAGLPGGADREADRALLKKAPYKATPLTAESYGRLLERLGPTGRRAVLAAALPDDPADLWQPGGVEDAAERMAGVWRELIGLRPAVHDEAADALEGALGLSEVWARRLAGGYGAADDGTVEAAGWELAATAYSYGVEVRPMVPAGAEPPYGTPVGLALREIASALVWAWTDRPVGDPAVAGAPALYEGLRAELDRPELLLDLPGSRLQDTTDRIAERFGPARLPVSLDRREEEGAVATAYDSGPLVVCAPGGVSFLRPAAVAAPEAWRRVREVTDLADALDRVAPLLAGGGLERMLHRSRSGAVPAGAYEADPRHSCPELVERAGKELGVGADAAALHLQLATLAAPTDRNVRRWNGWSAKQHGQARAELLATGAVVEAKRARAGRTLFLPGDWTEIDAPHLPLETAKLATHLVYPLYGNRLFAPFVRILPTAPLHEMFAQAWERR